MPSFGYLSAFLSAIYFVDVYLDLFSELILSEGLSNGSWLCSYIISSKDSTPWPRRLIKMGFCSKQRKNQRRLSSIRPMQDQGCSIHLLSFLLPPLRTTIFFCLLSSSSLRLLLLFFSSLGISGKKRDFPSPFASLALDYWYAARLISEGLIASIEMFRTFFILVSTGKVIAEDGTMTSDIAKGGVAVCCLWDSWWISEIRPDDYNGDQAEYLEGDIMLRNVDFSYPLEGKCILTGKMSDSISVNP